MSDSNLNGRRAVVTGAAQGIGRAIAERLLADGARVCIWDTDGDLARETATELGEDVIPVTVDVADPDDVSVAVKMTLSVLMVSMYL